MKINHNTWHFWKTDKLQMTKFWEDEVHFSSPYLNNEPLVTILKLSATWNYPAILNAFGSNYSGLKQ